MDQSASLRRLYCDWYITSSKGICGHIGIHVFLFLKYLLISSPSCSCPLYIPLYPSFVLLCVGCSFPLLIYDITRSFQLSSLSFSNITFQNSPRFSDRLSEMANFQHLKMLCSKCRISLFSSVISVQYYGERGLLLLNVVLSWKSCA